MKRTRGRNHFRFGIVNCGWAGMFAAMAICGPVWADETRWPAITNDHKPGCYWWWMGSAVDEPNIAELLATYQSCGLGGVHIIPIYGAKGYEDRYVEYLSERWMELLNFTVTEAARLGMWADMTTGTGWCFGGPNITENLGCALVQHTVHDAPRDRPADLPLQKDLIQAAVACSADGQWKDLTGLIGDDGHLRWEAPDGAWRIYVVGQKYSGRDVKRAAPGGTGRMLNPFYGAALNEYLKRFDAAFVQYNGRMPRAHYHDSFEYQGDWSPDLFEQFEKRRGYALQQYLPALFSEEDSNLTGRVKSDYRETISDMLLENFTRPWIDWVHKYGCITRDQAHGSPANLLDLYAANDIPETEMFNKDRDPLIAKFASSAAHVAGRRMVAAETGTWLREHFTETLGDLKDLVDELFASGVNHVIYHGNCYSPADAPWPGWLFYASTQMNPRNAIWHDAPALNAYIARCQSVLQAGMPDNNILLYWPIHDFWRDPKGMTRNMTVHDTTWFTEQPIHAVAGEELWRMGYTFDYISDRQLRQVRFSDGVIKAPGAEYKLVAIPAVSLMPLATLRELVRLAEEGATVIFKRLPSDVPGLTDLQNAREQMRLLLASLEWDPPGREARIGKGRFVLGLEPAMLAQAGIFRVYNPALSIVRRKCDGRKYWFVMNRRDGEFPLVPNLKTEPTPVDGWVRLGTFSPRLVAMDPLTGREGLLTVRSDEQTGTEVYLQLQPGQSILLRTYDKEEVQGTRWIYTMVEGNPIEIKGPWQVTFVEGGPKLPKPFSLDKTGPWTGRGDEEADCFAGTAVYSTTFAAAPAPFRLDLGRVAESARVRINGHEFGTLFAAPFSVTVWDGALLKPTDNLLEIEVTNLSANRIRDLDRRGIEWRKFHDINFVNIQYKSFDASGWPVRDSGLIGPVTLQTLAAFAPK